MIRLITIVTSRFILAYKSKSKSIYAGIFMHACMHTFVYLCDSHANRILNILNIPKYAKIPRFMPFYAKSCIKSCHSMHI